MKKLSIGFRLTLWYLAIFALGELVFGAGMWFILRENLLDIVDDSLESQVEDLKTFINAQPKDASLAKLQQEVKGTFSIEHSGDLLELYTEAGELIYRSPFLESYPSMLLPVHQFGEPTYRIRHAERQYFRFLSEKLSANGHNYIVQIGTTADDAIGTLHLFLDYLLLFAAVLLLVSGFVGYWISRRALAPVDALVRTARSIRGTNLSGRLQKVETGDELQRLSDTLNEMLDRIELAFQRITQFTADASHELRTPISLIRTEAELALRRSRTEAEYKESLNHILSEAERTTSLIEQLLEMARADSGREVLDIQPVDLSQTLRSVVDRWHQVSAIRNVEFAARIGDGPAFVMGNEALLRRLTEILLDNAFKYTGSPGSVHLSLELHIDSARITVQDSGVGIAQEDQNRIFERFYRVDKARSRAQGGTGLGLAIAQWIVSQHRGTIAVESRPGKGATFRVELPLTPAPVQTAQPV
jgi:heavy metal sensor kinase